MEVAEVAVEAMAVEEAEGETDAVEATVVEEAGDEETVAETEEVRAMAKEAIDRTDSEAKEAREAKAVEGTSDAATKTAVGAMVDKEVKAVVAPTPLRTEVHLLRKVDPWKARISTTPNWRDS